MNLTIPRYTVKDYELWKEDWELIGGYPFSLLPSPAADHSRAIISCILQLGPQLAGKEGCNCELLSELDWRIDEVTVLRLDLCIVCGSRTGQFITSVPILVIEILSPATSKRDKTIKKAIYAEQGVRYYILIDVKKQMSEMYELNGAQYVQMEGQTLRLNDNCEVQLAPELLWR